MSFTLLHISNYFGGFWPSFSCQHFYYIMLTHWGSFEPPQYADVICEEPLIKDWIFLFKLAHCEPVMDRVPKIIFPKLAKKKRFLKQVKNNRTIIEISYLRTKKFRRKFHKHISVVLYPFFPPIPSAIMHKWRQRKDEKYLYYLNFLF